MMSVPSQTDILTFYYWSNGAVLKLVIVCDCIVVHAVFIIVCIDQPPLLIALCLCRFHCHS